MRVHKSKKVLFAKSYVQNPAKHAYQNGKYLGSIIKNSVICVNRNSAIEITKGILTKTPLTESI